MAAPMQPRTGLVSIIVFACDHAARTRVCLDALCQHTRPPWELLLTRESTGPDIATYVESSRGTKPLRVQIVHSTAAAEDHTALAEALVAAQGDYLVLLDARAVVTDGWVDQLIALAESSPEIGMVGPMSNGAPPPQHIGEATSGNITALHQFAARWRSEHRGQWFTTTRLSRFCLLLKRPVVEAINSLGDQGILCFVDEDELSLRVQGAGFTLAVAHDLFVPCENYRPASPTARRQTRIEVMSSDVFGQHFGAPECGRAVCAYTTAADTQAVLTLLAHARPQRVLEIGTALGHMTANLTEWTPEDAQIYTLGIVRGMALGGAPEQGSEIPDRSDFGRVANHFGKAHKVFFITADSCSYDFQRLAPLNFVFIDGGHDGEHVRSDTLKSYAALAPGGWLLWHDFDSPLPWIHVRDAIEQLGLFETVYRVEGTQVAFLLKGEAVIKASGGQEPLRLLWEGDQLGRHSFALTNRALCRALLDRGHSLGLELGAPGPTTDLLPPDPRLETRIGRRPEGGPIQAHVAHRWPPRLAPPPEGRWVFMQPWEFGSLPRAWLPALDRADEIWAYSRYVRDCYLDAGVPRERIHVVPLGVDPECFRPGLEPVALASGPSIRFLFVGGTIHRKGIDLLLKAYERAFRPGDDVGLVVQDMGSRSFYRGQTAGAEIAALRYKGYPVQYLETARDHAELAALYAACDCLVHPYRGEGFALPVVEAMACGLPVIVTGAGPALDYADESTAYLVPARRKVFPECRLGDLETVGRPWLWEPDPEALADHMRRVAGNLQTARAKGMAASARIRSRFTWAKAAHMAESRLRALAQQPQHATSGAARFPVSTRTDHSPQKATVSLTMIVRNEEANLPACLESASGLFDEIVVVDTGSTDRTKEIARSYGARVFDFVWVDDFAAARNAALARARGGYIFWLDADDRLEPPEPERLRHLLGSLSKDGHEAAYVVRCACDPDPKGGGATVVDHIRLFPNREDVRWTYRVHEQILPSLRQAEVEVRWTDVTVRHTGYNDPALRRRKLDRDLKILEEELADRPDDPFVLFNLGCIAIEREHGRSALDYLRRSLDGSAPTDSITRKLYALIARAHQMLGEPEAALRVCADGLAVEPDDAELLFRQAVVLRNTGDGAGAEASWRRILTLKRPEKFSSVDEGIFGQLTRRNLAVLAQDRGDLAEALKLWMEVLAECPGDREASQARDRLLGRREADQAPAALEEATP